MLLVSINPDLLSPVGHGLYLDREMARSAAAGGWEFASWGHRDLPQTVLVEHPWLRAVFQDTSWHSTQHDAAQRERFHADLLLRCRAVLAQHPLGEVVLFLFAGHVCQLVSFWRLLQAVPDPRLRVVFNLYAAYWDFEESSARYHYLTDTLRRALGPGSALADRARFVLTSDSALIARLARQWWGAEVPVIPFFSLASKRHSTPPRIPAADEPLTAAYPSSVHRHRGFFIFPAMVRECRRSGPPGIRFVFRTCIPEQSLSAEERGICLELEELDCAVRYGTFSDEEMTRFFFDADIILNPYPVRYFKDRTSANVADALLFGKPVIATLGTWAGRMVKEGGSGVCFADGDAASMAAAVLRVAADPGSYSRRAAAQGLSWGREHNVAALFARVRALAADPPAADLQEADAGWKEAVLALLDAPAYESAFSPDRQALEAEPESCSATAQELATLRHWRRAERRLAFERQQNEGMRRALEHFRASPVRALRLWLARKRRRLTL